MKYLKRFGAALLALSMLLSGGAVTALADDTAAQTVTDESGEIVEQQLDTEPEYESYIDEDEQTDQKASGADAAEGEESELESETFFKSTFHFISYSSATTNGHRVLFQNYSEYNKIAYGSSTVAQGSCGPSAVANALYAAGIADVSIPDMCTLAVQCGARYNGGTDVTSLLKAAAKKYGFTYKSTSSKSELKAHLESGGIGIIHAGDSYSLFTYYGHFMAVDGISGNTVTVLDSYWYDSKFTETTARANNVKVVGKGVVEVSLDQIEKACSDRSPRYYLLYSNSTTPKVTSAKDNGDAPFTDVYEDKWYYDEVVSVYEKGLMSGMTSSTFEPDTTLTRAMGARILYNYEVSKNGTPEIGEVELFSDVQDGRWFTDAIKWARKNSIIDGMGNNTFKPYDALTREQLVTILYRYSGMTVGSEDKLSSYADASSVHNYAKDAMNWAVQNGIISGMSATKLAPTGTATRAQAAAIILRYQNLVESSAQSETQTTEA